MGLQCEFQQFHAPNLPAWQRVKIEHWTENKLLLKKDNSRASNTSNSYGFKRSQQLEAVERVEPESARRVRVRHRRRRAPQRSRARSESSHECRTLVDTACTAYRVRVTAG